MSIGYANFGTIEQANNQTVNQLAGLGQQIGNAIETHAATQSAQAMLPMLQQQYQNGMSKIASGDPNGLGDVYSASVIASQNPLLAPMANHAVSMAQSANINAQHMMRTQAYLQGKQASLYGQYGSGLMQAPVGMNPNWAGKQAMGKAPTAGSQISALNNFNKLDNDLATKQADARRLGDTDTYNQIQQQRSDLRNTLTQGQIGVPSLGGADALPLDTSKQINDLQKQIKAEQAKGAGGLLHSGTDQAKIQALQSNIKELQKTGGNGGLPALKGGNGPIIPQKAIEHLKQNPSTAKYFDAIFGQGAAQQLLNTQSSNGSGTSGKMAQTSPESQDETEAVGGGSDEQEMS